MTARPDDSNAACLSSPSSNHGPPIVQPVPCTLLGRLRNDCRVLGIERPIPRRVRASLRRNERARVHKRLSLMMLLSAAGVTILTSVQLIVNWMDYGAEMPPRKLFEYWFISRFPLMALATVISLPFALLIAPAPRYFQSNVRNLATARRYSLVTQCAEAIHACAEARRGQSRPATSKRLARRLNAVRRSILDAHCNRGTVPRRSHRKKALKLHERQVAAALCAMETELGRAPKEALSEIADALLTISDRYCETRLGQLLDEEQLREVQPLPNWEALRYLAALLLGAGGVIGLAVSGLVPESAEPIVYPLVVAAALVIAFGRDIRRVLDFLGAISGGP